MMKRFGLRWNVAGLATVAVLAALLVLGVGGAFGVTGAINSTDDPQWSGPSSTGVDSRGMTILGSPTQPCLNGPASPPRTDPAVNCNIYSSKNDVFLSGSPSGLSDGTYFFVVLSPGGQPAPNDGGTNKAHGEAANLSDNKDAWTNREFTVTNGTIAMLNNSTHALDDSTNNVVQVAPFADTPNPGGVYILAVCQVPSPANPASGTGAPGVDPHNCKYDAFKVPLTTECDPNTDPTCGPPPVTDLQVEKSANPTASFTWDAKKVADKTLVKQNGGTAVFTYTASYTPSGPTDSITGDIIVTNPNSVDATSVKVTDALNDTAKTACTVQTGTYTDGDGNTINVDPKGDTIPPLTAVDYPYTCSPPDRTATLNKATVTWDNTSLQAPHDTAPGQANVDWSNPTLVDDCVNANDLLDSASSATTLATLCVDKDGNLLTPTNVNNTYGSAPGVTATPVAADSGPPVVPAHFDLVYQQTYTVPTASCDTHTNTADFVTDTNQSTDGTTDDNSVTVTVCSAVDLGVTKDATPSWDREYDWSVKKTQTTSTTPIDSSATSVSVNYKVQATWKVASDTYGISGTIHVNNPNPYAVTNIAVSDTLYSNKTTPTADPNATCTPQDGSYTDASKVKHTVSYTGGTIPSGVTVDYPYTCSFTTGTAPAATTEWNQAKATWDASNGLPDTSATSPYVEVDWPSTPTSSTNCTTVTDSYGPHGGTPPPTATQLGIVCADGTYKPGSLYTGTTPLKNFSAAYTATATSSSPAKTWTFLYTRTVPVTPDTCKQYDNTATVTDGDSNMDNSWNASVTVCGPASGGLTMGFWQNKNGQGIISGQTGSPCPSVAYLRQFAPFMDLSATATCGLVGSTSNSTVVGYVYNVIKAATCSSTDKTCNTMLKAQMLATALDVYFSGSTTTSCSLSSTTINCGGDKIAGSNGGNTTFLGGLKIDLTKICVMTDGSTSSTCSGTNSNASTVFGGTTCMTVLAALGYQNTTGTQTTPVATIPNVNTPTTGTWYGQYKPSQVLAKNVYDSFNNGVAFTC